MPLTSSRRVTFALVTLLVPIVALALLEGMLRLTHYGNDLSLFRELTVGNQQYYVMNPEVSRRYFSRMDFQPSTSTDLFSRVKQPGTCRIFCLGASTTVGYPYWYNGAFPAFLRDRLVTFFPKKKFEIINLGLTATNSFTALDFAKELPRYEPDLVIVYDGHNEFYGALGASSHESAVGGRWTVNLYLKLIHLKTFLVLRDFYNGLGSVLHPDDKNAAPATVMERMSRGEYVAYGSDLYVSALRTFEANVRDLSEVLTKSGVPIILSTQVSNVRRQPPFISEEDTDLAPAEQLKFLTAFKTGLKLWLKASYDSSLAAFRTAARIDSSHAETVFRLAACLDTLGSPRSARPLYGRARDLDQLRFRTSEDFNVVIRSKRNNTTIFVADIEQVLAGASPDSIVGKEFILEHLHPNSRGAFLMAAAYATLMQQFGLGPSRLEWSTASGVSEDQLWARRPLTELDERIAQRKTEVLTSGWPFTSHPPHATPVEEGDTLGQIVENVARGIWSWAEAHEEAAAMYELRGDTARSEAEYRMLCGQMPLNARVSASYGRLLVTHSKDQAAAQVLRQSLDLEPSSAAAGALGGITLRAGRTEEAIGYYQEAIELARSSQERAENNYLLALAFLRVGRPGEAASHLRDVLTLDPANESAAALLSRINAQPH